MKHKTMWAVLAAGAALAVTTLPVTDHLWTTKAYADGAKTSRYKATRGTKVHGFAQRRGYYSYVDEDVIDSRAWASSLFTSQNRFRTPFTDQQSPAGPFDSGFFFDSGMGPRFNDSPYPR